MGRMERAVTTEPTARTYVASFGQLAFVTAGYWLVGLLPEENHSKKGDAWARIGAYRWAAWHFRKYLKYSDDSFGHASLGWCYLNLGVLESAVQHYRLAYARSKRADIACSLAQVESYAGNDTNARALLAELSARRDELSPQFIPVFDEFERTIRTKPESRATAANEVSLDPQAGSHEQPLSTSARVVRALRTAYFVFVIASVAIFVALLLWRPSTPAQLIEVLMVSLINGVIFGGGLLLVHAPVIGLLRQSSRRQLSRAGIGILGAALALGPLAIYLVILAAALTRDEIDFWEVIVRFRRPVDLLGFVPFFVGGAVFALESTKSDL